jgi:hypothetical protein
MIKNDLFNNPKSFHYLIFYCFNTNFKKISTFINIQITFIITNIKIFVTIAQNEKYTVS